MKEKGSRWRAIEQRVRGEWGFWLVVPFVFAVYLFTLTPTVGLIDSGELAAGCYLLNILHPTGYPLYTVLGRLASLIPVGTVVNRLALMSAVFSGAGLALFIFLCRKQNLSLFAAAAGAGLLGFSVPVWSVSTDVEVYSLTLVLIVLVWLAGIKAIRGEGFFFFGYIVGLTLTNHMSGLSTVLGAGLAFLLAYRKQVGPLLPRLVAFFLLGLSPYLFLLIRARCEPLLAWGNPVTLERLWWHITGRQYQVWMFSASLPEVLSNAGRGGLLLLRTFGFVFAPVVGYGWVKLFKQERAMALGLGGAAVLAFIYAVNYQIPDIDAYYIPVIVPLAVCCVTGLEVLQERLGKYRWAVWLVIPLVLVWNYPSQNHRNDWVAYDQAINTLASADSNAIIITDWWDCYAPIFYLQHVAGLRSDVCLIDKELVRRSWYFRYLQKAYPWLIDNSRVAWERFLKNLDRFEHNQPYDPREIQESYIGLLRSFFVNNPRRPAYTTFFADAGGDARQLLNGFRLVPMGILVQVRTDTIVPSFDYHRLKVRLPGFRKDERRRVNLARYRFMARRRIELLQRQGRWDEAQQVFDWLQKTFPAGE